MRAGPAELRAARPFAGSSSCRATKQSSIGSRALRSEGLSVPRSTRMSSIGRSFANVHAFIAASSAASVMKFIWSASMPMSKLRSAMLDMGEYSVGRGAGSKVNFAWVLPTCKLLLRGFIRR